MKLACPKCHSPIASEHVNIREGVASCSTCHEYFRIADYLRDDEEVRRLSKPNYSKVTIDQFPNNHLVTIPPAGWNGTAVFLTIFALLWNVISWPFLLFHDSFDDDFWSFIIIFPAIGVVLILITIFAVNGRAYINFNRETVEVVWQLFGARYRRVRQTSNLDKITESVAYTKNNQPVYGIGLLFHNEKKVVFGSSLKEEERKWLIGELYEMKNHYQG